MQKRVLKLLRLLISCFPCVYKTPARTAGPQWDWLKNLLVLSRFVCAHFQTFLVRRDLNSLRHFCKIGRDYNPRSIKLTITWENSRASSDSPCVMGYERSAHVRQRKMVCCFKRLPWITPFCWQQRRLFRFSPYSQENYVLCETNSDHRLINEIKENCFAVLGGKDQRSWAQLTGQERAYQTYQLVSPEGIPSESDKANA